MSVERNVALPNFKGKYPIFHTVEIKGIIEKIYKNILVIRPNNQELKVRRRIHLSCSNEEINKWKAGSNFSEIVVYTGVGLLFFTNSLPAYKSFRIFF